MTLRRLVLLALVLGGAGTAEAKPTALPVPGFRPAALLAPAGPGARPLVVGLHGNFDRPEWFCESLEELVLGRAWVLCPRGLPRGDVPASYGRWTFSHRQRVLAELEAGARALAQRQPGRVSSGPVLLAGFSLGAILASRLAVAAPARFPRLYLVEGGQQVWTPATLASFARGGGKALVLGCGSKGCGVWARQVCAEATRRGLGCAAVVAPQLGHSYTAPLPSLAREPWRRLLAPALE